MPNQLKNKVRDPKNNLHYSLSNWGLYDPVHGVIKEPLLTDGEPEKMNTKVKKILADGAYKGEIMEIEERKYDEYSYFDISIREAETELVIKCGVPFNVSANTKLGIILTNFGAELKEDTEIDTDDYIKAGQKVDFVIVNQKSRKNDNIYPNILPDSLKPSK